MKEFKFESRTKFKVRWGGEDYVCECPSQKEIVDFASKAELCKSDGNKINELTGGLLVSCGLPVDVYEKLEINQVKSLVDFISAKKN